MVKRLKVEKVRCEKLKFRHKNWLKKLVKKIGQKNSSKDFVKKIRQKNSSKKFVKKNHQIVIHNKEPQENSRTPKQRVLRTMTTIYDTILVRMASLKTENGL